MPAAKSSFEKIFTLFSPLYLCLGNNTEIKGNFKKKKNDCVKHTITVQSLNRYLEYDSKLDFSAACSVIIFYGYHIKLNYFLSKSCYIVIPIPV